MERKKLKNLTREAAQDRRDRISSLTNDLLVRILSYLPQKEAIRTSELSKRWRYTHLDMRLCCRTVDGILIFQNAPKVKVFKFICHSEMDVNNENFTSYYGQCDSWIYFAWLHSVEELYMSTLPIRRYKFPCRLLLCESLTTLELSCHQLNLPQVIRLSSLRSLSLHGTKLGENDIKCLSSGCSVLSTLRLIECNHGTKLKVYVTNPSLKNLRVIRERSSGEIEIDVRSLLCLELYENLKGRYIVKNMVSLTDVKIGLRCSTENLFEDAFSHIFHRLQPVKLQLNEECLESIFLQRIEHPLRLSWKTKCLNLETNLLENQLKGIACLLSVLPNLESLKFSVKDFPTRFYFKFSRSQGAMDCHVWKKR